MHYDHISERIEWLDSLAVDRTLDGNDRPQYHIIDADGIRYGDTYPSEDLAQAHIERLRAA